MDRPSRSSLHSPVAWACLLVPLVLGLFADLYTKHWAFQALVTDTVHDSVGHVEVESVEYRFIDGFLHFRAHVNYGAVFGIGKGARELFIAVSAAALLLLGYLFYKSGRQYLYQVLLGMLVAGVLGNLYDRAFHGYVRDMIYALSQWGIFPWIFNIADSLLCTGVAGMFVYTMFRREDDPVNAPLPDRERTEKQT